MNLDNFYHCLEKERILELKVPRGLWDQEGLDDAGFQEAGVGKEGGGLKGIDKLEDGGRAGKGGINTISLFKK